MAVACWPDGRTIWGVLALAVPHVTATQSRRLCDMMRPVINAHLCGELAEREAVMIMRDAAKPIVPGGRSGDHVGTNT
jgi:hypothetical protein